jgi:hypothetical protein
VYAIAVNGLPRCAPPTRLLSGYQILVAGRSTAGSRERRPIPRATWPTWAHEAQRRPGSLRIPATIVSDSATKGSRPGTHCGAAGHAPFLGGNANALLTCRDCLAWACRGSSRGCSSYFGKLLPKIGQEFISGLLGARPIVLWLSNGRLRKGGERIMRLIFPSDTKRLRGSA